LMVSLSTSFNIFPHLTDKGAVVLAKGARDFSFNLSPERLLNTTAARIGAVALLLGVSGWLALGLLRELRHSHTGKLSMERRRRRPPPKP
jgi:hypothetical protein